MPYSLEIPGWMPEAELQILERLAQGVPEGGSILEIGPFCGRSSWCWAKSAPSASVTCIDIWNTAEHRWKPPSLLDPETPVGEDFGRAIGLNGDEGTLDNFRYYTRDCPNIRPIRGTSPHDFQDWPDESLDLVFVDGLHQNPGFHADVNHWFWRVKPGGLLCGDDCNRIHPDVLWTIHDFAKDFDLSFTVERRIWTIRRPLEHRARR